MDETTASSQEYFEPKLQEQRFWRRYRRWILGGLAGFALILLVMIYGGLPSEEEIKSYRPEVTAKSANGINWSKPRPNAVRVWTPLSRISKFLQQAVIISEDDTFYQHDGVNFKMMREAFLLNWKKGRYVRGASTISMQLARNAFLTKEKTLLRKIREIIVTHRMEKVLTKSQILELYLNIVEWGDNVYGAEAAAHYYFGKSAANLSLYESSLMASLLPNPIYFNPFKRPNSCRRMQERVLKLMLLSRAINQDQFAYANTASWRLRSGLMAPEAQPAAVDALEESKYEAFFAPEEDTTLKLEIIGTDSSSTLQTEESMSDTLFFPQESVADSLTPP
jgi:monofunctional biosynthetic peptidoglycan transglycosylase